jgi:hypothetical protein
MPKSAEDTLAEVRAELLRDRATFEQRVSSVLEQLTQEKIKLAEEWRRLLAGRQRLVLVGRRLRRRWQQRKRETEHSLDQNQAKLVRRIRVVERAEIKSREERAKLASLRAGIRRDAGVLRQERAELIAYRSRFEAERLGWQEAQQRRLDEERELQRRLLALRREVQELEFRMDQGPRRAGFGDGGLQKVA